MTRLRSSGTRWQGGTELSKATSRATWRGGRRALCPWSTSRTASSTSWLMEVARGAPRATSINQLVEDAVRLVDHGQRARRPPRHVALDVAFDSSVPPCHLVPEDLSRVILNLLDNGCYAAQQKAGRETDGQPRLKVS